MTDLFRPTLDSDFELRIQKQRAYVTRCRDGQAVGGLTAAEAVVLALMNGRKPVTVLCEELRTALGDPTGPRLLRHVMDRFHRLLINDRIRESTYDLETLSRVVAPDPEEGLRPLPGPRVLHWCVTEVCPRRCAYCYANPIRGSLATDALLTRNQLRNIFKEAAKLGARYLLLGGGEPLLRRDLPEVLGGAVACGIVPLMTTKHYIPLSLAKRLADAGVPQVSVSLDSIEPEVNLPLVGTGDYLKQACDTIRNLRGVGLAVAIQTVITSFNVDGLDDVASFAAGEGAKILQLVRFIPVRNQIAQLSNKHLQFRDNNLIRNHVEDLKRRHPELKVELFEDSLSEGRAGHHCDIGQTKMFFLPDGVVHRCYKLTDDPSLRGGDLKRVSVAAAWHDPDFRTNIMQTDCQYFARFDASSGERFRIVRI